MQETWQNNLVRNVTLRHQRLTSSANFTASYPQAPWTCSAPFAPLAQPQYFSASTGAKRIIFVVDVSSTGEASPDAARMNISAALIATVLPTLSTTDAFAVVTYSDVAVNVFGGFVRGSETSAALLALKLHLVVDAARTTANLVAGLEAAVTAAHQADGNDAACANVMILMTTGKHDVSTPYPPEEVVRADRLPSRPRPLHAIRRRDERQP
jgi:hypothetical protein